MQDLYTGVFLQLFTEFLVNSVSESVSVVLFSSGFPRTAGVRTAREKLLQGFPDLDGELLWDRSRARCTEKNSEEADWLDSSELHDSSPTF